MFRVWASQKDISLRSPMLSSIVPGLRLSVVAKNAFYRLRHPLRRPAPFFATAVARHVLRFLRRHLLLLLHRLDTSSSIVVVGCVSSGCRCKHGRCWWRKPRGKRRSADAAVPDEGWAKLAPLAAQGGRLVAAARSPMVRRQPPAICLPFFDARRNVDRLRPALPPVA